MDVSIITINYNSSKYTLKLIESIIKNIPSNISYEIIITDNASHIDDYKNLTNQKPNDSRIKIHRSTINTGFSGGNMYGYKNAKGKNLLFINNDCICLNDVLTPLLNFIKVNKSAALLTGKILGKDGKSSGTHKLFPSMLKSILGTGASRMINRKFISPKNESYCPIQVQVVSGAFMFFRRDVFDSIGGFDTDFFLYCEEEDISMRIWNIGMEVYMIPESKVFHEHGGSSSSSSDLVNEYYISYRKLIFKHYNFLYGLIMMSFVYLSIIKNYFKSKVNIKLIKLALKGFPEKHSLRYKENNK